MDLVQRKLTKIEWEGIEIPTNKDERRINKLIMRGFYDVSIRHNYTLSLLKYLKIAHSPDIDKYVYCSYLQKYIKKICDKYQIPIDIVTCKKKHIKKKDLIRFSNTDKNLEQHKTSLFEFIIINFLECLLASNKVQKKNINEEKNVYFYYYTIRILLSYRIELCNICFIQQVTNIIETFEDKIHMEIAVYHGYHIIEKNDNLLRYADECLYEHQKQLFTLCKRENPKLISYIAPTGTGKTMSPLGLSEQFRVIFVCAARHVGLALARAAVSEKKKVAFAFGCGDAQDIRLHYFSAKECIRNKRTGGIRKVDNSVGDNVEIMISDIKSFLPAMLYMLAFNPKENIILYWDEPTITLDYEEHEFHDIIKKNWQENLIPNVVLSSATLPRPEEMAPTFSDFCVKFPDAETHTILSYDCKKTIPLFTKEGFVSTPHLISHDYGKTQKIALHCEKFKTLLRYIDLGSAIKFIKYVNENNHLTSKRYEIKRHFPTIETVSMVNIKEYYLLILRKIKPENWEIIYHALMNERVLLQKSYIRFVSDDAHTFNRRTCNISSERC